jgi:hypothetical protein
MTESQQHQQKKSTTRDSEKEPDGREKAVNRVDFVEKVTTRRKETLNIDRTLFSL